MLATRILVPPALVVAMTGLGACAPTIAPGAGGGDAIAGVDTLPLSPGDRWVYREHVRYREIAASGRTVRRGGRDRVREVRIGPGSLRGPVGATWWDETHRVVARRPQRAASTGRLYVHQGETRFHPLVPGGDSAMAPRWRDGRTDTREDVGLDAGDVVLRQEHRVTSRTQGAPDTWWIEDRVSGPESFDLARGRRTAG